MVNVKTTTLSQRKRNPDSEPITSANKKNLDFLRNFTSWLIKWKDDCASHKMKLGLSKETFIALIQTTNALVEIAEFLLDEKGFNYVLLGKCQSDDLEERFGWYRQLCGANFFVSVRQVLEAEKGIRLKSLLKFSQLTMKEVGEVFSKKSNDISNLSEVDIFTSLFEDPLFLTCNEEDDANVIFYVAGYLAKTVGKLKKCQSCLNLLFDGTQELVVKFEDLEDDTDPSSSNILKERFLEQVTRGGLKKPSDLVYLSCIYIWNFYNTIMACGDLKAFLMS